MAIRTPAGSHGVLRTPCGRLIAAPTNRFIRAFPISIVTERHHTYSLSPITYYLKKAAFKAAFFTPLFLENAGILWYNLNKFLGNRRLL